MSERHAQPQAENPVRPVVSTIQRMHADSLATPEGVKRITPHLTSREPAVQIAALEKIAQDEHAAMRHAQTVTTLVGHRQEAVHHAAIRARAAMAAPVVRKAATFPNDATTRTSVRAIADLGPEGLALLGVRFLSTKVVRKKARWNNQTFIHWASQYVEDAQNADAQRDNKPMLANLIQKAARVAFPTRRASETLDPLRPLRDITVRDTLRSFSSRRRTSIGAN